jgi:hypothetical protein
MRMGRESASPVCASLRAPRHPLVPAVSRWVRERLARPRASWWLAGLALIVLLPTLWSGLVIDDFFQRLIVEGRLSSRLGRLDLFELVSSSPTQRAHFEELGIYPWWIGPHTQISYWRPLAALTHLIDYSLWPRAAWLMHLENLAWYAALVLACAALYRRFISVPWVAGFAAAYYAFDHAHAYPAAWVANRNALMSTFFGVLSLLAHDRWRTRRRLPFGVLAWAAFACALLSAEAGVAIVGYTAAYALCFERNEALSLARDARKRLLSLVPYAAVMGTWRLTYHALGHGVVGSGINMDPLTDGAGFLALAFRSGPLLLASDVIGLPPDILFTHPEWTTAAALGALIPLALLGYAALPLLRSDRSARFFVAGSILSTFAFGGTFPSDRYLFWVGLGVMGIVAQLVGGVFGESAGPTNAVRYAVCCACIVLRGVVSPAVFPLRTAAPGLVEDDFEQMVETIPRGPDFADQTVVLLNAPLDAFESVLPFVAMGRGEPAPAHMYMLYAGRDHVTVTRTAPNVLEERVEAGWFSRFTDRLYRNTPLRLGDTIPLAAMSARVESLTGEGRPSAVEFTFPTNLDDRSLVFLSWGPRGFERVTPPAAGAHLTVDAAPFLVSDLFRPRIRERAMEEDR